MDGEDRNSLRAVIEKETDAIILGSVGTFSTGVNIINLENTVFASPSKGKIKNLQAIGRGLRKGDGKTSCDLYDIGDNFRFKGKPNVTLTQFDARINLYEQEKFDYKIHKVSLKGKPHG